MMDRGPTGLRTWNDDIGRNLILPGSILSDAGVLTRIACTRRVNNQAATPVQVHALLVTATQMQLNSVLHPSDLGCREAIDDRLQDQLVGCVIVDITYGRGERRRTRFGFVITSDSKIGRSAGLPVVVASNAHVFSSVGAAEVAYL